MSVIEAGIMSNVGRLVSDNFSAVHSYTIPFLVLINEPYLMPIMQDIIAPSRASVIARHANSSVKISAYTVGVL